MFILEFVIAVYRILRLILPIVYFVLGLSDDYWKFTMFFCKKLECKV